jgi:uncharacterized OB-fold protein
MNAYAKPIPAISDEMRPFYVGAKRHELWMQRCRSCGVQRFPARAICSSCLSTESEWVPVSGRGEIFSFNVMHQVYHPGFASAVPYAVVIVRLAEGAKMLSNLVGVSPRDIRIGMPVRVVFDDITDEIDYARARPGQLSFALGGIGSSVHLAGEAFKLQAKVFIVNIPYRGTSPAVADVLAGNVPLMFAPVVNTRALIHAGKLKALGVTSLKRLPQFPDVPAAAEDYIHRVGRTARMEAIGDAMTLVSPAEETDFRSIERAVGKPIARVTLAGFNYSTSGSDRRS